MRPFPHTVLILFLAGIVVPHLAGRVAADQPDDVTLTVYGNGFAMVKEDRTINIAEEVSAVQIKGVAATIQPATVAFSSLTDPEGTRIVEQNYQYDMVDTNRLLQLHINQNIGISLSDGNNITGKLLFSDDAHLGLLTDTGVSVIRRNENVRSLRFAALPDSLLTEPTLLWKVHAAQPGEHKIQVAYQAAEIAWRADYVAVLNDNDSRINLGGWATVENRTGTTFHNARLKLMGGNVQWRREWVVAEAAVGKDWFSEDMSEKQFFEYYLYEFPERTTLANNEIKQLRLLSADNVKVTKSYRYQPTIESTSGGIFDPLYIHDSTEVNVLLEVSNTAANQLGKPLPAGTVRVYKRDGDDGSLEFVGQDDITHTKRGETVSLHIGNAYDLNGKRQIIKEEKDAPGRRLVQTVEITLTSAKEEPVTVKIKDRLPYRHWKLLEQSDKPDKEEPDFLHFQVEVPPMKGDVQGKRTLTYTIEYSNLPTKVSWLFD